MPPASRTAARDEILAMVKAIADAQGIEDIYDDVPDDIPDSVDYIKTLLVHQAGNQATLANSGGQRRYEKSGLLTIQIYTAAGGGLANSDTFAQAFEDGFEGKESPSGVWFRSAFSNEFGKTGNRFRTDVFVSFEYDLIK